MFTETNTFNLVSQGGSDNLRFKLTLHVTVNANGVETVTVEHFFGSASGRKKLGYFREQFAI